MKTVSKVDFVGGYTKMKHYPALTYPEIAFAGRSNVGKSSLINRLLGHRIARTGSTPGRTRQLNFFAVNDELTFVDLPGYGYAKVSKSERRNWQKMVEGYLVGSPNLCGVVIIIDIRRGVEDEEAALATFLQYHKRPFVFVATKCDKVKPNERTQRKKSLIHTVGGTTLIFFSAQNGAGKGDLWNTIIDLTSNTSEELSV